MILLDPGKLDRSYPDARSAEIMRKTVGFFEAKGKKRLLEDYYDRPWYADFLEFVRKERIFASMCTPAGEARPTSRWDTWRNCEFAEILGFYGLQYWYTWQVSVLGLGPDLDEPQRGAPRSARRRRSRTAASSPSVSPRRPTAPTSTRPTWCSRETTATAGAPTGASTTSETATRPRSSRPSGASRTATSTSSSPPIRSHPSLPPRPERRREPELRLRVRAARLPGAGGGHPPPRTRRLGRRAQHRERRQVQPGLGLDRHLRPMHSTRRSPTPTTGCSTGCA